MGKNPDYDNGKRDVIFGEENHIDLIKENLPPFSKVRDVYNNFLDEHLQKSFFANILFDCFFICF